MDELDELRAQLNAVTQERDVLRALAGRFVAFPEGWREQVSDAHACEYHQELVQVLEGWCLDPATAMPAVEDHGIRSLLVHPAAWDGVRAFLSAAGFDAVPMPHHPDEGFPTFIMGVSDRLMAEFKAQEGESR